MVEKKQQHFVPKFYLKNFSYENDRKSIGIYSINTKKFIPRGNLRNQACDKFFYGKNLIVEDAFSLIEGCVAQIITQIINTSQVPKKDTLERLQLYTFLISLSLRTKYAAESVNEAADQLFKIAYKEDPRVNKQLNNIRIYSKEASLLSLRQLENSLVLALDLNCKLIINKTSHMFITSDNPIVKHNTFVHYLFPGESFLGFGNKGLLLLLNLNPNISIMLYDDFIYRVGNKRESLIEITDYKEIDEINKFIYLSADKSLYFNHDIDEFYLLNIINESQKYRKNNKVVTLEYEAPPTSPNTKRSLIHTTQSNIKKKLDLPFIKIKKKERNFFPQNMLEMMRNPELAKEILEKEESKWKKQ